MIRFLAVCVLALCAGLAPGRDDTPVRTVERINPSLAALDDPPNLATPQSSVENFVLSARDGRYERAARSLHFRLLGDVTEEEAARAAERLFFVLNQELWIDWEGLPDRPDGMVDRDTLGRDNPLVGQARRGIRLGAIAMNGREVPIRLERVAEPGGEPVWLFSAQTVENIGELYEAHGPSALARFMPDWARTRTWLRVAAWKWIALAVTLVLAPLLGWVAARATRAAFSKVPVSNDELFARFNWPIVALVTAGIAWVVVEFVLALPSEIARFAEPGMLIALIAASAWVVMRALTLTIDRLAKDAVRKLHDEDSAARRRVLTQVTVVRHVLVLVVALAAVGIGMIQLGVFRTFGVALLSSAGAAAVILGIAGHAVIGNLIAGLQIALTQPFTLGDTVYVEDNWGRIEDITYTYVIVRTWDERRLVLPIKYFIEHWFENWSITDPFLVKPIYLHVDYRADVDAIRDKFRSLLEGDADWDEENDEPEVLVTDTHDDTMVVRLTCGGANPSDAWSLSCRVREKMVAWLRDEAGGEYLPRHRLELDRASERDGA